MIAILLLPLAFLVYIFKIGALSSIILLIAFVVCGFGAISLFKRKQYIGFLFVLVYLLMYFPNPFLVGLGAFGIEAGTSDKVFAMSNALLILGIALFFLGTAVTKLRVVDQFPSSIYFDRQPIYTTLTAVFFLAALGLFFVIALGGGWRILTAPRLAYAQQRFTMWVRLIGAYMYWPFIVAAPLLIIQLSKPLQFIPWVITAVLLFGNFLIFRARTPLIGVMSSLAIGILLKNRVLFTYEELPSMVLRTFRRYFAIAIIVVAIPIAGIAITFTRGLISEGRFILPHRFVRVWAENTFDGGDLGYTKIMRYSYVLFPSSHRFLKGQSYWRVLLIPIPRSIMPMKPENTQRVFCSVMNPDLYNRGGTIPAGILGDLYINFGHIGIIGMFIYGLIFGRERYNRLWHWIVLGACPAWLFHFVRGGFTNPLVIFLVFLIVALLLEHILQPSYMYEEYYEGIETAEIGQEGTEFPSY